MTLVPFIDILTIMVVFLLVHTSDVEILPNTKNISIPESIAEQEAAPTVVVMITKDDLLVRGELVATRRGRSRQGRAIIAPLQGCSEGQAELLGAEPRSRNSTSARSRSWAIADTPYSVLRKVMATCTDAEYGKVSLAVIESEAGARAAARAPPR